MGSLSMIMFFSLLAVGVSAYPLGRLLRRRLGGPGRFFLWLGGALCGALPIVVCMGGCSGPHDDATPFVPFQWIFAVLSILAGFAPEADSRKEEKRRLEPFRFKATAWSAFAGTIVTFFAFAITRSYLCLIVLAVFILHGAALDVVRRR